jgi:hypothetical protein
LEILEIRPPEVLDDRKISVGTIRRHRFPETRDGLVQGRRRKRGELLGIDLNPVDTE